MSFETFSEPRITKIIDRLSQAKSLAVVVGAGASVESYLPSWPDLVEGLLRKAYKKQFPRGRRKDPWVAEMIRRHTLTGAAAFVVAAAGDESTYAGWLTDSLFRGGTAADYRPGPIASQVARLHLALGSNLAIVTTNYDDLLEQAIHRVGIPKSRIRSYICYKKKAPPATTSVTHLHGYAAGAQPKGIVLSEKDYHQMQMRRSWQERLVRDLLRDRTCVFVGTSLTDPNLIRYLYSPGAGGGGHGPHYALFARQSETGSLPSDLRSQREDAVGLRWAQCGVESLYLDHFIDVAQLLHEVSLKRESAAAGETYVPPQERARALIARIQNETLRVHTPAQFVRGQRYMSRVLQSIVSYYESVLNAFGLKMGTETLGASIWLCDRAGRSLRNWASSYRMHGFSAAAVPVPLDPNSDWVAAQAFCGGVGIRGEVDTYASPWHSVIGLPMVFDDELPGTGRLPIGCLTICSNRKKRNSVLTRLAEENGDLFTLLNDLAVTRAKNALIRPLQKTTGSSE